jgi:hypothetical protein
MNTRGALAPKPITIVALIVSFLALLPAAAGAQQARGPEVGQAIRHDISPPLAEMGRMSKLVTRKAAADREVNPLKAPPERPGRPDFAGADDPLRQTAARLPGTLATPAPLINFEGLSDDDNAAVIGGRVVPPDTEGDVGPSHYVQWINLIFAVYSKTTGTIVPGGGPFAGNSLWAGFGGPCQTNNDGDPIVLYDHLADRWLFSQFSINEGIQCVALSTTGNPLGPYSRWAFAVSPGQNNDYPKFGLMPDAYYLSLRDFPSGDGDFASAVAFDRVAMLAGSASPTFVKFSLPCLSNNCPDGIQPPHLEGPASAASTPGIFSKAWDDDFDGPITGVDGYRLWEFVPDFVSPGSSTFTELPIVAAGADFDNTMCGFFQRACIRQPQGGERVDPIDELQMYRAVFRHFTGYDALLINTTVDATGRNVAGIRWAEMRNIGGGWTLYQDGTYAPAGGDNRWAGSAAMDKFGNIALGYSVSSGNVFPSVRYTSRMLGDPLGTLPGGEVTLVAGSDVQKASSNRWGDYSAMSVDPVDDCTFWYTQEYQANDDARKDFDFKTRIGSFKLPGC